MTGEDGTAILQARVCRPPVIAILQVGRTLYGIVCLQKASVAEKFQLTCTTDMCPWRTANVNAVQCRVSGCTDGCRGELLGTYKKGNHKIYF